MLAAGFEEFVAIVDHGSLTAAARALALPRPTLSKRLAKLETRLGVRLLHRTTRRLTLTEQGAKLYERARHVVDAVRVAEAEVQRIDDIPRGLLRVLVPARVPAPTFMQWLVEFLEAYPEVHLDVVGLDAHIDLVEEGFDVALRNGEIGNTSLVSRTLVVNAEIAVASPTYLAARGTPTTLEDLRAHDCIVGYAGDTVPTPHWPRLEGGTVPVTGTLRTNQADLALEAARRGHGLALVVDRTAQPYLDAGELVWVLRDLIGRRDAARLLYPDRAFMAPKVRAFIDFIAARVDARHAGATPTKKPASSPKRASRRAKRR